MRAVLATEVPKGIAFVVVVLVLALVQAIA